PADVAELVVAFLDESPAQLALEFREDVDAERSRPLHGGPARRVPSREEAHERRVERHGGERPDGEAVRLAFVRRGDDGDPGWEVAEHVPEAIGIEVGHRPKTTARRGVSAGPPPPP